MGRRKVLQVRLTLNPDNPLHRPVYDWAMSIQKHGGRLLQAHLLEILRAHLDSKGKGPRHALRKLIAPEPPLEKEGAMDKTASAPASAPEGASTPVTPPDQGAPRHEAPPSSSWLQPRASMVARKHGGFGGAIDDDF